MLTPRLSSLDEGDFKYRKGKLDNLRRTPVKTMIKKYLFCRWFHKADLCYPEVWKLGLNGPWHCARCEPCGKEFENLRE